MSGIRISPKHGVNPSMSRCYFCGGEKNELILTGMLPGDAEAPREAVWNTEPCDQCKEYMKQGVIIISVRDGEDERMAREQQEFEHNHPPTRANRQRGIHYIPNPHRTAGWWVVKDEALQRFVQPPELLEQILRARFVFMPDQVCDMIGLKRG